jgi:hypothetical protein
MLGQLRSPLLLMRKPFTTSAIFFPEGRSTNGRLVSFVAMQLQAELTFS